MKPVFKNWVTLMVIIVIFFLFWLLLRGCHNPPVADYHDKIDSMEQIVVDRDMQHTAERNLFNTAIDSLEKIIHLNKRYAAEARIDLQEASKTGKRLAAKNDSLKLLVSQLEYYENCDSMVVVIQELDSTARVYISMYDILQQNMDYQVELKDSVIAKQDVSYRELMQQMDNSTALNREINKAYLKSEKKRKFNKNLNRVLAAALLVVGGIAISK